MMRRHVIYFDGECSLCNRTVCFLQRQDKKHLFRYEPLGEQGETLIFLEEGKKPLRYGKGALRIFWHLGGLWRLLGIFSFLPAFIVDPIYRLIARNRHFLS
ncbi:MAG: DUF393 domain-containing protein [Verrucomicrobia bacterium]|nr:DUF393 domain-containing protein [Verrucomicrobiota bacterium]